MFFLHCHGLFCVLHCHGLCFRIITVYVVFALPWFILFFYFVIVYVVFCIVMVYVVFALSWFIIMTLFALS
jgi:hypothetical protein